MVSKFTFYIRGMLVCAVIVEMSALHCRCCIRTRTKCTKHWRTVLAGTPSSGPGSMLCKLGLHLALPAKPQSRPLQICPRRAQHRTQNPASPSRLNLSIPQHTHATAQKVGLSPQPSRYPHLSTPPFRLSCSRCITGCWGQAKLGNNQMKQQSGRHQPRLVAALPTKLLLLLSQVGSRLSLAPRKHPVSCLYQLWSRCHSATEMNTIAGCVRIVQGMVACQGTKTAYSVCHERPKACSHDL